MSLDVQVALSPARTYRALVAAPESRPTAALFGRVALVALILGTAVAISTTHRVTLGLVASTTLCWSFVVLVQILAAALLIRFAQDRRVPPARALALFFMGHVPWSLWILAFAVRAALWRSGGGMTDPFLLTAPIALVWTVLIVAAFCREVLGLSARAAALGTLGHQSAIWGFTFIYGVVVVQAWPRFLNLVGR